MPSKTIEVPPAYHSYAQQFRRFLRREIPLLPPMWALQLTASAVQFRGDWVVGPVESTDLKVAIVPGPLSRFLKGEWLPLGEISLRLKEPSPILLINSSHLEGQRLALPPCEVGVDGLPDPILTAIEPHAQGLLLHLTLRLTRAEITVLARFPAESA